MTFVRSIQNLRLLALALIAPMLFACSFVIRTGPPLEASSTPTPTPTPSCLGNLPFESGAGTLIDPYRICNAAQLANIATEPTLAYTITEDIDLTSATRIDGFQGILDGGGFTLRSFSGNACLLSAVTGATIQNLVISDATITADGSITPTGFLICDATNATLSNIQLRNSEAVISGVPFGGIAGSCSSCTVTNITIDTITITSTAAAGGMMRDCSACTITDVTGTDITISAAGAGGMLDTGEVATVTNATLTNLTVTSTGGAGGLLRRSIGGTQSIFKNITNINATISDTGGVAGGVIGSGEYFEIVGATVSGSITSTPASGSTFVGGIVGISDGQSSSILQATNTATVSSLDGYTGGIIGRITAAVTLSNVSNSGAVSSTWNGNASYSGGLVGYHNDSVVITHSKNTGAVSSELFSGGLIGRTENRPSFIANSYNTGAISSSGGVASGLIGDSTLFSNGPYVSNSFSSGTLSGADVHGIMKDSSSNIAGPPGRFYATYFDSTAAGTATSSGGGTAKSTANMILAATYSNYDKDQFWNVTNGSLPTLKPKDLVTSFQACDPNITTPSGSGTVGDPYLLCAESHLDSLNPLPNSVFKLVRDIYINNSSATLTNSTFDGDNHIITGKQAAGTVFNTVTTSEIKNTHFTGVFDTLPIRTISTSGAITNVSTSGVRDANTAAGLVGDSLATSFSNVKVYVDVTGIANDGFGGVSQLLKNASTVSSADVEINVTDTLYTANGGAVGGITARFTGDSSITDVRVRGTINIPAAEYVGGISGHADSGGAIEINRCSSNLTITALRFVGGLVGQGVLVGSGSLTITDASAAGNITASTELAGGLTGRGTAAYTRVWSAGVISGIANSDAVAKDGGTFADCFYNSDTAGLGTTTACVAKTTAQMFLQGTFTNFDFSTSWNPPSAGYPTLR